MLEGIYRLVRKGFPLNADKLMLLMRTITILGFLLCQGILQLGHKAIRKLFGSTLPRSLKDV